MEMSNSDKKFIARLEAMPLEQARRELASGTFGAVSSPNHSFALSWLAVKEAESRDDREETMLSLTRSAKNIAIAAMIVAIMASIITIIGIIIPWLLKK